MYRVGTGEAFEAGLESAYPIIVPSPQEAMAKRILDQLPPSPGAGRLPPGPRRKPRTGKRMPITSAHEKVIRDIIEDWSRPVFFWKEVVAEVNKRFGTNWHRQSLESKERIKKAFQAQKQSLREDAAKTRARKGRAGESTAQYLQRQLREANERADRLERDLIESRARLARWQHNAYLHGLSVEMLDAPLQQNDRGRSD